MKRKIIILLFLIFGIIGKAELKFPNNNINNSENTINYNGEKITIQELEEKNKGVYEQLKEHLKNRGINEQSIEVTIKALSMEKNNNEKLQLLEEAVKLDDKNTSAYLGLGHYYEFGAKSSEDLKKALEYYKKVYELSGTALSYGNMGKMYYLLNENEKAKKIFEDIIEKFPNNSYGYYGMILVEIKEKNYDKAYEYSTIFEKYYPQDNGWGAVNIGNYKISKMSLNIYKKNYIKVIDDFFKDYPDMADYLPDYIIDNVIKTVIELNENVIKEIDLKIYNKNIEKFKELDLI